jgi:heptosyltransferase-2
MHVASALGINTVAVFGSTDPQLTGPLSENAKVVQKKMDCAPCFKRECPYGHYECLTSVTVDEVVAAAGELIGEAA